METNMTHFTPKYKFGLQWAGENGKLGSLEAREIAEQPTTKTLIPCKEESIDFDNAENIFIEGDNLDVLKILLRDYKSKIKMIYI